jgi:hypothetical protein
MSLDRKDVRFKVEPELHQAIAVLAEAAVLDIGELCEQIVRQEVLRQVHVARVVAQRTAGLGIAGNFGESQGTPGKTRE